MRYVAGHRPRAPAGSRGPARARPGTVARRRRSAPRSTRRMRQALVHRDVKPADILIADGDHALPHRLRPFEVHGPRRRDLTATGEFLGTVAYVAPEQIEGAAADHRADVYSFDVPPVRVPERRGAVRARQRPRRTVGPRRRGTASAERNPTGASERRSTPSSRAGSRNGRTSATGPAPSSPRPPRRRCVAARERSCRPSSTR